MIGNTIVIVNFVFLHKKSVFDKTLSLIKSVAPSFSEEESQNKFKTTHLHVFLMFSKWQAMDTLDYK